MVSTEKHPKQITLTQKYISIKRWWKARELESFQSGSPSFVLSFYLFYYIHDFYLMLITTKGHHVEHDTRQQVSSFISSPEA